MERNRGGRPRHPDILTPAEWRVLDALRDGGTNAEIAARLGIGSETVKYHVANMLSKLELRDRRELAAWRPGAARSRLGALFAVPAALGYVARPLVWFGVGTAAVAGVGVAVVAAVAVALVVLVVAGNGNGGPELAINLTATATPQHAAATTPTASTVGDTTTPAGSPAASPTPQPSRDPAPPANPSPTSTPAASPTSQLDPTPTPPPSPTEAPGSTPPADAESTPAAEVDEGTAAFVEAQVDGATLDISLDTPLDVASQPAPADFVVTVGGALRPVASVAIPSSRFVRLTLPERVVEGEAVTVAYRRGATPLLDLDERAVPGFGAQSVANLTGPSPTLSSAEAGPLSRAWVVKLTFPGVLDRDSMPAPGDFAVTVNGSSRQVTEVSVETVLPGLDRTISFIDQSGRSVVTSQTTFRTRLAVAVVAPTIGGDAEVTIAYTRGATPLRDSRGNEVQSFGPEPVVNTFDPPRLRSADVDGRHLFLAL